jgi:RimJ/RimL family protein N-acetyltransferase
MKPFPPLAEPLTDGVVALRLWRDDDADALMAMVDDPMIVRWTTVPSPYTRGHAREWFELCRSGWASGERAAFAIVPAGAPDDGVPMGSIDLRDPPPHSAAPGVAEIGYLVGAHARGRGVARRAVALLTDWAFEIGACERIEILVQPANDASIRVPRAVGYREEGLRLADRPDRDGALIDLVVHARERDERPART